MKRILLMILTVAMVISLLPLSVFGAEGYSIAVETGFFGNISKNKNVAFTAKVTAPVSRSLTLVYRVVDDYGMVKYENQTKVSVTSGNLSDVAFTVDAGGYGVFVLETELYCGNELVFTKKTDFSVIKTTTNVNDEMGIHVLFNNDSKYHKKYNQDIIDLYNDIGVSIRRDIWAWDRIERVKGEYMLTDYLQEQYDMYAADGRDLLLSLNIGNTLYTETNQTFAETPEQLEAWGNYCYNLALLTRDLPVTFETINEYDLNGTSNENYVDLLEYAYKGIKKGNPKATVLGMVASSANVQWMKEILDLGGGQYMDGIAFHPYAWDSSPERFKQMEEIGKVRQLMADYGMADKPLWISEVGWYKYVGRENQASYHVRLLALNKKYKYVDKTIFYRYAYAPVDTSDEGFGFIENYKADIPFSAFPALPAMANYNAVMTDAEFKADVTDNCYLYTLKDGTSCIMLWSDEREQVSLDLGVEAVVLSDMYGNEKTIYGTDGKYTFTASSNISYIFGAFNSASVCDAPISLDKCTAYNKNGDFDTVTVACGGTVEIEASQNVSAFLLDEKRIAVNNHSEEDGYVYVRVMNDGKCKFYGKIKSVKLPTDSDLVYDMDSQGYTRDIGRGVHRGIFKDEINGEKAVSFNFTNVCTQSINSPEFTKQPSGNVKISYDLYLTGNVKTEVTNYHGGSYSYFLGTSENGYFAYGENESYAVKKDYETGRWYHLESIIHMAEKTAVYYVDGEYIGSETNKNVIANLYGIRLGVSSDDKTLKTYVKNLRVTEVPDTSIDIDKVEVSEDNRYAEVEFSNSVSAGLENLVMVDSVTCEEVLIHNAEKLTSTQYKVTFKKPLKSQRAYTISAFDGLSSAVTSFSGTDYTFISNKTNSEAVVSAMYSAGDSFGNTINNAGIQGEIVIEFSEPLQSATAKLTAEGTEIDEVAETISDRFLFVSLPDGFAENTEYCIEVSDAVATSGKTVEDIKHSFTASDVYSSITDFVKEKNSFKTTIFEDDFSAYASRTNAPSSADGQSDNITTVENPKWTAGTSGGTWWGRGIYPYSMNGNNVLRIDNWQSKDDIGTRATTIMGVDGIKDGIVEITFDAAAQNPQANIDNGYASSFIIGIDDGERNYPYPVFSIKNKDIKVYKNLDYGETEIVADAVSNTLSPDKYKLVVDFTKRKVFSYIQKDGSYSLLCEATMNSAIRTNGIVNLSFEMSKEASDVVLAVDTSAIVDNVSIQRVNQKSGITLLKNDKDFFMGQVSQGDTFTIKSVVENLKWWNVSYKLICAYYEDGTFVGADSFDVTASPRATTEKSFTATVPEGDMLTVKCMLFNSIEKLSPQLPMVVK